VQGSTPAPTAISTPSTSPDTNVQQTTVILPATTAGATPVAVTLPEAAGFATTMLFPLPLTATNAQVTEGVSNAGFLSMPALGLVRLEEAGRHVAALPRDAVALLYIEIYSTVTIALPTAPSFIVVLPAAYIFAGANYYIALYDPTRPSLGWQYDFEGPATVTNTTLTFAANPAPFTFTGRIIYFFTLYAIPKGSVQPTPAPSTSPTSIPTQAPPTATPTTTPSPSPVASSTSPSLKIGITVPTPAPIVCSPAPVVVAVGQTVSVGCSEAVYGGAFQLALADPSLATVTLPTPVPVPSTTPIATPTSTVTAAPTPISTATSAPTSAPVPHVFSFTITGVQIGTTTLSVTALDGGAGLLTVTVTP
jgi:hypothetical protein